MVGLNISMKVTLMPLAIAAMFFTIPITLFSIPAARDPEAALAKKGQSRSLDGAALRPDNRTGHYARDDNKI